MNWPVSAQIGVCQRKLKEKKKKRKIGVSEERCRESGAGAAALELHPCFLGFIINIIAFACFHYRGKVELGKYL